MAVTLESLKKTVGKKKTPSRAYAWLADLERASGDLDGALRRVDSGLGLFMNDLPGLLVRSRILFEKKQYEDCIAVCEMALKNDPFCLSAQKRMGEAYDQLGNAVERNKCFRRVHDMDPLDNFWKEEYDVVLGTAAAVEDSDFVMPGLSGDDSEASADDDGGLSFLSSGGESSSLVKENSFNTEESSSEESGLFEKSLDSDAESVSSIFSSSATDKSGSSPFSLDAKSSLDDINTIETNLEDDVPAASNASTEDDPFAALSALLPSDDDSDSASMDNLQASLDAAMSNLDSGDGDTLEEFPADENISGGDVSNVLSDMFGDDSFEDSSESKSPFSNLNIPKEVAQDSFNAKNVESDSFSITNDSSMFGLMEKIDGEPKPKVAAPAADQPMSVDSAFASIFGEDELPEENPSPAPAVEESVPAAEVEPEKKPAADQPMSVDTAFASIFGEDELPEENPSPAPVVEELAPLAEEPAPSFEESPLALDDLLSEDSSLGLNEPAAEESVAEKLTDDEPAAANDDSSSSVDSAFANIFGDDELPEENSESPLAAFAEPVADEFVANKAEEPSSSSPADSAGDDSLQSIDNAFANIFGADELSDDKKSTEDVSGIFNENPETRVVEPADELAGVAEPETSSMTLAEQVKNAEEELDFPSSASSGVENDVGGAFESIFGSDNDDLTAEESSSAATEESVIPANVDNSLESEVSGAFKDLFHTDDDVVPETDEPFNKGVDFLMSGDSDDEVSVGLIKDPSQPLANGETDIDERLNTKTLAEIYFEQGLYGKALDIYQDLCIKEPSNAEYQQRAEEIEKIYREKFGGN